jgi:hypothetical protein
MNLARVIVLVLCATAAPVLAAPSATQLAKDRAAAAEKVYRNASAMLKTGRGTVEGVYQWSVRWLDADRDSAKPVKPALAAHLARMQELETELVKARDAGTATTGDADAATYFRLEAEGWQARGRR